MYFEDLWKSFSELPEITAIALGGSRAGADYDEKSDYDLYLYCTGLPEESVRKSILEKNCGYMEIGNSFWELEDDCTLKDGTDIDILYHSMDDFRDGLAAVVEQGAAYNGYTTCMWHNLLTCRILYDRDGALQSLKNRFDVDYPMKLKRNIISRNRRLLHGYLPSYDGQIRKAASRNDMVAVNHRTAAFMESYFDILFALNEMTHPGEKRMVELLLKNAQVLPADFEENIQSLYGCLFSDPEGAMRILAEMLQNLEAVLPASLEQS